MVVPGSVLCTEEEFAPGLNTLGNENGEICSISVGVPSFDHAHRIVSVQSKSRLVQPLQAGSKIIGRIVVLKDNIALVEILSAFKNDVEQAVPNSTAGIPVSLIERGFVRSAKDRFRLGDIVAAKVEVVKPWGIDLSTNFAEFGVVKSFCGKCKSPLVLKGQELKCVACNRLENRKVSSEYVLKE